MLPNNNHQRRGSKPCEIFKREQIIVLMGIKIRLLKYSDKYIIIFTEVKYNYLRSGTKREVLRVLVSKLF